MRNKQAVVRVVIFSFNMSDYQHAVLFEANSLSDGEMKKIRNYFKIRRQSGGGECGEVEKVRDNTYKISFLEAAGR